MPNLPTQTVPGLFHVSTLFFHLDFIPLIPMRSFLVIGNRAIQIPLSCRSIGIAWLRFLATVLLLGSLIAFIVNVTDPVTAKYTGTWVALGLTMFFGALAYIFMWHKLFRNASYERATQLCQALGHPRLKALLQGKVDEYFGQQGEFAPVSVIMTDDAEVFLDEAELQLHENDSGDASSLPVAVAVEVSDVEMAQATKQ